MPIYEYYCPDNNRIYQFYAKTLAQGRTTPKCPDDPSFRMLKIISGFNLAAPRKSGPGSPEGGPAPGGEGPAGEGKPAEPDEAALAAMEREFSQVDENDPRAMGRMMRRMAELTGEKIEGEMEEVVRKLEEGTDPEALEEQLGGGEGEGPEDGLGGDPGPGATDSGPADGGQAAPGPAQKGSTRPAAAKPGAGFRPPTRDPRLYDY